MGRWVAERSLSRGICGEASPDLGKFPVRLFPLETRLRDCKKIPTPDPISSRIPPRSGVAEEIRPGVPRRADRSHPPDDEKGPGRTTRVRPVAPRGTGADPAAVPPEGRRSGQGREGRAHRRGRRRPRRGRGRRAGADPERPATSTCGPGHRPPGRRHAGTDHHHPEEPGEGCRARLHPPQAGGRRYRQAG